uniref:Uracil-DNA glycosylase n=1 Tax=uncultured bacterium UPO53 TaxID=1776978 RepID=A0A126SYF3_9BACT|nr:uracil-DNA glycosylase [uncultured bacterium UPO53]
MNNEAAALERVKLDPEWKQVLASEFLSPYMHDLRQFIEQEKRAGKTIYPPGPEIFNALNTTPLSRVKVVILGQDPYHGPRQAHGLCFSVRRGVMLPPSLQNIYAEIQTDLGIPPARHGDLTHWAEQGVLLLNSVLTVQAGQAASHQNRGWETFTDAVVRVLNEQCEHLVFMLWGSYAQRKGRIIDTHRHLVLKAVHPSPLSANRGGWFGCRHFSQANRYLEAQGLTPIDWSLPA